MPAVGAGVNLYNNSSSPDVTMDSDMIVSNGGSQPHTNVMPFLCIHFIVSLFGIYPSRT